MTGGRVVMLGPTGRNFAAGMSGGVAYVLDEDGDSRATATRRWSSSTRLEDPDEIDLVAAIVKRHAEYTESERPAGVRRWEELAPKFVKIYPNDYRRVMETQKRSRLQGLSDDDAVMAAFEENSHDIARAGGK